MMRPLVVCVTRHAGEARQPVSASRSKIDIRQASRIEPDKGRNSAQESLVKAEAAGAASAAIEL